MTKIEAFTIRAVEFWWKHSLLVFTEFAAVTSSSFSFNFSFNILQCWLRILIYAPERDTNHVKAELVKLTFFFSFLYTINLNEVNVHDLLYRSAIIGDGKAWESWRKFVATVDIQRNLSLIITEHNSLRYRVAKFRCKTLMKINFHF